MALLLSYVVVLPFPNDKRFKKKKKKTKQNKKKGRSLVYNVA